MSWKYLIRFKDAAGKVRYGEPITDNPGGLTATDGLQALVMEGTSVFELSRTSETVAVSKILGPLAAEDVPLIKCVGLNYAKHIREAGRTPPPYPSIFIKPSASVAGPDEVIPIPALAQDDQLDYEGEMCIIIGKTGKNIPKSKALDYVLGYTIGNDLSTRKWQRDPKFAGNVPQWCFSKGFDKFAPLGPQIVSPSVVKDASTLSLKTYVNGELRQDSNTSDLLFDVPTIIEFISQGTTLEKGTVIMTGTPEGTGMGLNPPQFMKDGDVVEVHMGQLGKLVNRVQFE